MATNAPDVLVWLADEWEKVIPSAECSGIVNDSGDRGKTSKHWSRQDNPSGSWAVTHSKDKKGPSNMSAALDMTMQNQSDMFTVHKRFKALFNARDTDPRAAYVDCFNGWDGNGSPGRYDLPAGTVSTTDDSHKWHEHVETFYQYTGTDKESWKAARAILSVVKGETVEQWLDSEEGDVTKSEFMAWMTEWSKSPDGKKAFYSANHEDTVPMTGDDGELLADAGASSRMAPDTALKGINQNVIRIGNLVKEIEEKFDQVTPPPPVGR